MGKVSLELMLECRERRVLNQQKLILIHNKPVISFCMNIAGSVKTNYFIERGFSIGIERLIGSLYSCKIKVIEKKISLGVTGPEALLVVDSNAKRIKKICIEIEERDNLGRLFDIDVIGTDGKKLEREADRLCLLCSNPARLCASRRLHSVLELWNKTTEILYSAVLEYYASKVASMAVKALMYEVLTTPKPGLVDRSNNGSHSDMDMFTFAGSSSVLFNYFYNAYKLGFCVESAYKCFEKLRELGKNAECLMFFETNGVNTHKGAIFSLGIVCCAFAFTEKERSCGINDCSVFDTCASITKGLSLKDFCDTEEILTNGQKIFKMYGHRGIRGEFEDGIPSVKNIGLPVLERLLQEGKSFDEAGANTLLALIACTDDTNIIARGGLKTAEDIKKQVKGIISGGYAELSLIGELDNQFIKENLSPGGAADLLAVCYFLHFVKSMSIESLIEK